ncbi:hypothetical protein ACF08W_17555 [Streptomyces sp. NPDC015144]|uniref:hypothetical protein n=1 Tax=Streptomyces sp. NPDC015144 TaxID=3364944 RepID=UPI0036FEEE45
MSIGLLSTIASTVVAAFYGGTVSVLALTATFARRRTLRREARSTLALLVPGRPEEFREPSGTRGRFTGAGPTE